MSQDTTFAYIKFISDNSPPIYELVYLNVLLEHLEEFETICDTIKDLEMEYHNNFMIVNHLPMQTLPVFKILNQFLTTGTMIDIDSVDEQIMLLHLLCKFANKRQINNIMESIKLDPETWVALLNENFDAKNYFDETRNLEICKIISDNNPGLEEEKYLDFYGFAYFKNLPEYYISTTVITSFPQRRVRDKKSKDNYQLIAIGKKAALFNRQKNRPLPVRKDIFEMNDISEIDCGDSNSSSSSENEDRESTTSVVKLSKELIGGRRLNNFILNSIDVYFADRIDKMLLIETTPYDRYHVNDMYKSKKYVAQKNCRRMD